MARSKKLISILLLIIAFLFTFSNMSFASEKLDVVYFYSPKCLNCRENLKFIDGLAKDENINLIKYNTEEDDCTNAQSEYAKHFGVDTAISLQIPAIYFGEHHYILAPSNHEKVLNEIMEYTSGQKDFENFDIKNHVCTNNNIYEDVADNMTIGGILLAGLIDGINPCAISMLLVFYSFLMFSDEKKKIIWLSIFFILGMFIANFTFGMGINVFYNVFAGNKYVLIGLYLLSFAMCIVALTLNTMDIYNHNKSGEVKNQMSDKVKFKMTDILRRTVFSKFALPGALLVGLLIGAVELSCTGQIYLPTLVYMISNSDKILPFTLMLVLYNLMFIIPLVLITIVAYFVKNTEELKGNILKNNHIIKIIGNIFFIVILVLLIKDFIALI